MEIIYDGLEGLEYGGDGDGLDGVPCQRPGDDEQRYDADGPVGYGLEDAALPGLLHVNHGAASGPCRRDTMGMIILWPNPVGTCGIILGGPHHFGSFLLCSWRYAPSSSMSP